MESLRSLPAYEDLAGYDGSYDAQVASKRATSELTGRFTGAAVLATRELHGERALGRYEAGLVVPEQVADECALLKAIALRYVMRREGVSTVLTAQRRTLRELVGALVDSRGAELSLVMRPQWYSAADEDARLRVVIDQVAQLTDSSAIAWHERLCGARS
jgi:dGTPase